MSESNAVIVIGTYRSGTSLSCRILDRLGVDFGPKEAFWRADRYNPAGYFERLDVNDANGKLLESVGHCFVAPPEPDELDGIDDQPLQQVDLSWTARERWWGLKDPRLCATLHVWLGAHVIDPDRVWIVHVQRKTPAIIRSVLGYPPFQEQFGSDGEAARKMVETYQRLTDWQLERLKRLERPIISVDYEAMVEEPTPVVERLARFLEIDDRRRVRRASAAVGLRRARWGYRMRAAARKLGRMVGRGGRGA